MSLGECWLLPREGYLAVDTSTDSLAIVTEGDGPIRFITFSHEYARFHNGLWRVSSISTPSSLETGLSWLDSTTNSFIDVPYGDLKHYRKSILATQTSTVTVDNTVTETSLIGSGLGSTTLPANYLNAGKAFRISSRGTIEDTGNPDITIKLLANSTTLLTTGNNALTITAGTFAWEVDILLTYRGGNTFYGEGWFRVNDDRYAMIGSAVTIDPTVAQTFDLTVEWGTADPANTISSTNFVLET